MGEIKSTLDLVFEKTRNLTLSDEEKRGLAREKLDKKVQGLCNRYLDNFFPVSRLKDEMEKIASNDRELAYNFLKKYKQTGILVSQKRSSQLSESAEAAGGLAVAHIVDGTIVLDKKLIESRWDVNLYGLELGSILRTIRIDGCRLCGHDSRT